MRSSGIFGSLSVTPGGENLGEKALGERIGSMVVAITILSQESTKLKIQAPAIPETRPQLLGSRS
jgi:hypothetical protein